MEDYEPRHRGDYKQETSKCEVCGPMRYHVMTRREDWGPTPVRLVTFGTAEGAEEYASRRATILPGEIIWIETEESIFRPYDPETGESVRLGESPTVRYRVAFWAEGAHKRIPLSTWLLTQTAAEEYGANLLKWQRSNLMLWVETEEVADAPA